MFDPDFHSAFFVAFFEDKRKKSRARQKKLNGNPALVLDAFRLVVSYIFK